MIWSGDEQDGYLSSHRSMIIGTHTGHGVFGPPTGKVVAARCIADCYVKDDVIDDEWLCYDMAAMVQQLGHTPESWARASIAREGGPDKARRPFTPAHDLPGPYKGRGNDHPLGQRLADILTRIMAKDIAVIRAEYDRAVHVWHPGGATGWGIPFAEAQWLQLRTAFPDASVQHRPPDRPRRPRPARPRRRALVADGHSRRLWRLRRPDRRAGARHGLHPCRVRALGPAPRIHPVGRGFHLEADPAQPAPTTPTKDRPP